MLLTYLTSSKEYREGNEDEQKTLRAKYMPADCVEVSYRNLLRFIFHNKTDQEINNTPFLKNIKDKLTALKLFSYLKDEVLLDKNVIEAWSNFFQNIPGISYVRCFKKTSDNPIKYETTPLEKGQPVYVTQTDNQDFYFEQGPSIENIIITLCYLLNIDAHSKTNEQCIQSIKEALGLKNIIINPQEKTLVPNILQPTGSSVQYTCGNIHFINQDDVVCKIVLQQKHCITQFENKNSASGSNHSLGEESIELTFWNAIKPVTYDFVASKRSRILRNILPRNAYPGLPLLLSMLLEKKHTDSLLGCLPCVGTSLSQTIINNINTNLAFEICQKETLNDNEDNTLYDIIKNLEYTKQNEVLGFKIINKLLKNNHFKAELTEDKLEKIIQAIHKDPKILRELTSHCIHLIELCQTLFILRWDPPYLKSYSLG